MTRPRSVLVHFTEKLHMGWNALQWTLCKTCTFLLILAPWFTPYACSLASQAEHRVGLFVFLENATIWADRAAQYSGSMSFGGALRLLSTIRPPIRRWVEVQHSGSKPPPLSMFLLTPIASDSLQPAPSGARYSTMFCCSSLSKIWPTLGSLLAHVLTVLHRTRSDQ